MGCVYRLSLTFSASFSAGVHPAVSDTHSGPFHLSTGKARTQRSTSTRAGQHHAALVPPYMQPLPAGTRATQEPKHPSSVEPGRSRGEG